MEKVMMEVSDAEREGIEAARTTAKIKQAEYKRDAVKYVQVNELALMDWAINFKSVKHHHLMMYFMVKMNKTNAVCVSQAVLCKVLGCARQTLVNAIKWLEENRYINIYKVGVSNVYVINSDVGWKTTRNKREFAIFNATMVVDMDEQNEESIKLWNTPLHSIPQKLLQGAKEASLQAESDLTEDKQQEMKL
jgi:DNA-binding MarR family transcriptional regulator